MFIMMKRVVKTIPFSDKDLTSRKPTVEKVITAI